MTPSCLNIVAGLAGILCAGTATAAAPAVDFSQKPQPGVYECYGQNLQTVPLMFGIIDATNYMSSDGKRGRYAYDVKTGVLSLDPGAMPARYQRISAASFRLLRENGELGGFVCPLNKVKNPARPPW